MKYYNILLVGETGVGKSTFINAFANYLNYSSLEEAVRGELITLIPSKFTITDDDFEIQIIKTGHCKDEVFTDGASATQSVKSYVFCLGDLKIRLIDTPGIGDTRGIDQDKNNFEMVLSYMEQVEELHGICILLKPNNARLTVLFEYCIKQLFSRLERSASRNIIFLFTNSRSTFYRPGDTLPPLKVILEETRQRGIDIPLYKGNIFCIDSEAFRFLVALSQGIRFSENERLDFEMSWKNSSEECIRLLIYIAGESQENPGLTPHKVQKTVSVNRARDLILLLSQPLADIFQLIQDNILVLKRHEQELDKKADNLNMLEDHLYIPVIDLHLKEFEQPRTVCTAQNCCEVYMVNGNKKFHYRQICHNPCYLKNVPDKIIGTHQLISCAVMNNELCTECGCNYLKHMHIYYESETYEYKIEDTNVKSQILNENSAKAAVEQQIKELVKRRNQYEVEQETIIRSTATFANFLEKNSITPYNDAFQGYIEYLLDREQSLGQSADKTLISGLQKMLKSYCNEKSILENAFKHGKNYGNLNITADKVFDTVEQLYYLEYCGPNIRELSNTQQKKRSYEYTSANEIEYPRNKTNGRRFKKFLKRFCNLQL